MMSGDKTVVVGSSTELYIVCLENGSANVQELMGEDRDKVCPEATTNFFNRLTFGWISALMVKGFK